MLKVIKLTAFGVTDDVPMQPDQTSYSQQRFATSLDTNVEVTDDVPMEPYQTSYSQQRFATSLDTNAEVTDDVPVQPDQTSYSQQRFATSLDTNAEVTDDVPTQPDQTSYSQQRFATSLDTNAEVTDDVSMQPDQTTYSQHRFATSLDTNVEVTDDVPMQPDQTSYSQQRFATSLDTNVEVSQCGVPQAGPRCLVTSAVTRVYYIPNDVVVEAATDTGQGNCVTSGVDDIDGPQCGQFYEVALDETPSDAAEYVHPSRLVHDGRLGYPPMSTQVCGMMAESRRCVMVPSRFPFKVVTPAGYTSIAVPEVRQCTIPPEQHPCGDRFTIAPQIRPPYLTQDGHHYQLRYIGQPSGLVPGAHQFEAPVYGPSVHVDRGIEPFAMALHDDRCRMPQHYHPIEGPRKASQSEVVVERLLYHRTTLASPMYHETQVIHPNPIERDCYVQCDAPPDVTAFPLSQSEDPPVTRLQSDAYDTTKHVRQRWVAGETSYFGTTLHKEISTGGSVVQMREEYAEFGHCCTTPSPCIQPTPRTMHCQAPGNPFDRAVSCCADHGHPSGRARGVEANKCMIVSDQIRMRRRWDITDQPVRPIDTPSNHEACLTRHAGEQTATDASTSRLCSMGKEPSREARRDFKRIGEKCEAASCAIMREVPSCELMPDVSQEMASCEITCETTTKRKEWWVPLDERPMAAVVNGLSPKIMRDQTCRSWKERNTRNCSRRIQRNAVILNRPHLETTRGDGILCEDSRDRKRCRLCQDEALGGAEQDGVMAMTSKSRHSRHDTAPAAAVMARTEMQWDYYIPGLPDNSRDHDEGFIPRRREHAAKPDDVLPPKPNMECMRSPPTEVHQEPTAAEEETGPVSWTRFLRKATRKAFHVVCQVVQLIAPDATPAVLPLPSSPGADLSVPRVPRLERSALCRRCLREEAATVSEKLHAAPSMTSSSFLARYFSSESSHVSHLSEGLRQCIHNLEMACALATAFPQSKTLPAPVLEKSLSDPALPLQRISCPRHTNGSPGTSCSHSDSLLHDMTSMSTNANADLADTNNDQDWDCDDASSTTYTTARPTSEHANDDSELSESQLLSPWHNIDQYSLVFVDAADDVIAPDRGEGGDSLDDVASLKRALVRGDACTLSWSQTTATDLHSMDSGDICRKSDFSDDELGDVLDWADDVANDVIVDQRDVDTRPQHCNAQRAVVNCEHTNDSDARVTKSDAPIPGNV